MKWLVNPLWGKTINWRAGCGRSASPVRREGETNKPLLPTPMGVGGRKSKRKRIKKKKVKEKKKKRERKCLYKSIETN